MSDVVVRRGQDELVGLGVPVDGRKTEILHVVGPAALIQQDVPIGPPHCAAVEVVNHAVAVAFCIGPTLVMLAVKPFLAPFGEQQFLVGVRLLNQLEVVVLGRPACPRLVPVEAGSPSVRRGHRVFKDGVGPVRDQVAVVVPHHNVLVAIACFRHGWSQVMLQEVALFLCRVNARFPALRCHRFVLDGHPPHGQALGLVRFDELDKVLGPRVVEFGEQGASAQHVLVGLHERRRAPWAGVKHQIVSDHLGRPLNHRDALDFVRRDGKRGQRRVAFVDVGVASQPKVARVDAGPDDVVPNALRTEIGVQQGLLLGFTQQRKHLGGGVRDCPSNSQVSLEFLGGVHKNGHLGFQGLVGRLKFEHAVLRQTFVGVLRGDVQPGCGQPLRRLLRNFRLRLVGFTGRPRRQHGEGKKRSVHEVGIGSSAKYAVRSIALLAKRGQELQQVCGADRTVSIHVRLAEVVDEVLDAASVVVQGFGVVVGRPRVRASSTGQKVARPILRGGLVVKIARPRAHATSVRGAHSLLP